MPEGSDGVVRAEFQNDQPEYSDISNGITCNIMVMKNPQTWTVGYTSSGGSDSKQNMSIEFGRCTRRGHTRSKRYMHSDHHGCQRGVRSGSLHKSWKRLDPSNQRQQGTIKDQTAKEMSLCEKQTTKKLRKRKTSCNYDDYKKDGASVDIIRYLIEVETESAKDSKVGVENDTFGIEMEVATANDVEGSKEMLVQDNKKSPDGIVKPTSYLRKEGLLQVASFQHGKDNKETYEDTDEKADDNIEKGNDKLDKYEKEKSLTDDTQKEKSDSVTADIDVKSLKVDKERLNKGMVTNSNMSHILMMEKQKLKKEDVRAWTKMDSEKEDTEKENQVVKVVGADVRGVDKNRADNDAKNADKDSMYDDEKLRVNLDQGKSTAGKNGSGYIINMDNKDVEEMEKRNKDGNDETTRKAVLDPLAASQEEEKSDKTDESKIEETLGFEVKDLECVEDQEPDNTLNFERAEKAEKLWYERSQRGLYSCNSIDETSCSFSEDCPLSTDWQSSADLESSMFSQSFHHPVETKSFIIGNKHLTELYPANYLDSNVLEELWKDIMMQTEVFREHCKNKIFDFVDTKLTEEEQHSGSSKEKEQDGMINKDEVEDNECKIDNDGNEKEKAKGCSSDENVEREQADIDTVEDGTEKIEGSEQADINNVEEGFIVVDGNDAGCLADRNIKDMNKNEPREMEDDCEPMKFLDAEDKDDNIKEHVEVLEDMKPDTVETEEISKALTVEASVKDADEDINGELDRGKLKKKSVLACHGNNSDCHKNRKTQKRKRQGKSKKLIKAYNVEEILFKEHPAKDADVLTKEKETFTVDIPKQDSGLASKKNWTGRGYSMFVRGNFGRRCSANSDGGGGKGGNMNGDQNSSSSNNNGDKNTGHHRNHGNNDREDDEINGNNNNGRQNDGWYNPPRATGTSNEDHSTRGLMDITKPEADYKRYKKKGGTDVSRKHTTIEDCEWLMKISVVTKATQGPTVDLTCLTEDQWVCILEQLNNPEELSEEMLCCNVCIMVQSLLKHYSCCTSAYNSCDMCVKMFSLICSHVAKCIAGTSTVTSAARCEIRICTTIKLLADYNIVMHLKTLWFQVRKKLARILNNTEEDVAVQQAVAVSEDPKPRRTSKVLSTFSGPLQSIPEGTPLSITSTSRSGSRVLRKKSSLPYVGEQPKSGIEAGGEEFPEEVDSKHGLASAAQNVLYSRAEIPDESDVIPTSSENDSVESAGSASTEGSGQFVVGPARFVSVPMGPPGQGEPYYPSLKDKPTGIKGIGEVVYGSVHQLVKVSIIWEKYKTQYLIEAKLARHYTEEGVILPEFKNKLKIKGLRYQNDFQWVKVTHLGNGMTGKCHLAMDFETEFKFCVKEIHISNYEKEEIELWSELDNPYIVQVYGAIRHGEKIYILQELIEGGCLTEAINVQRKLGRRLSQLTALRYFQQLLLVLKYLKSRNILHEDLKADNILLNKNSNYVSIKVADFGLARRCQGTVRSGTKPVGTQTQWSPEKAEARVGYGFAAEIWAAICVLVHMLSGQPPWVRRYESYKALIIVIVEKSPPTEDIPRNIHESIKDLIKRGFTMCQGQRPTAEQLLDHHAFKLLDDAAVLTSINGAYSILESIQTEAHTNQIDYDPTADLREIYRNLLHESEAGAAGGEEKKTRGKDKKAKASFENLYKEEVPYYSNEYRVCAVPYGDKSSKNEMGMLSFEQRTINENTEKKKVKRPESIPIEPGYSLPAGESRRTRLPSQPDNNVDPSNHIARFLYDVARSTDPPEPFSQLPLRMYDPNMMSSESEVKELRSRESSVSSGTVTDKLIPDFSKIGFDMHAGEDLVHSFSSESDEGNHDNNFFNDLDDDEALERVRDAYTVPTVVNTSADQTPGSQFTSSKSSSSLVSEERSRVDSEILEEAQKHPRQRKVSFIDDYHSASFNDDDLFGSGPPKGFDPSVFQQTGNAASDQGLSLPPSTQFPQNTINKTFGDQSLPAPYRQGHIPNSPLTLPRSAPTNSTQTAVGRLPYMHSNPNNSTQQQNMTGYQTDPSRSAGARQIDEGRGYQISRNQYLIQPGYDQPQLGPHQLQQTNLRPSSAQQYGMMPRSGEGQIGNQGHRNNWMHGADIRSEMQQEDLARGEVVNHPYNRSPYDQVSMPNRPQNFNRTSPQHQSLSTTTAQFIPYQTSTPRTDGNMYGARPKVPQVLRQLFPGLEDQQYVRRTTDPRINDPRQVYEQITGGHPVRMSPYAAYPAQPKTPILNPPINPRPPPPQEGHRLDLRLDIDRAQHPPEIPGLNYSQTAPVFSPPKTPSKKSPDFRRTLSEVPIMNRKISPQSGITSASSSKEDKMSTSASKSQFEEQDEAFRELSKTAEEALSQHSDHGPIFLFGKYEDDINEEIHHEVDDRFLENPAESLAHVLDPQIDSSITVTFRSSKNGKEFKMKFMARNTSFSWEKLIQEELDCFSRVSIAKEFQLQRFTLKLLDGSSVDLESCLGNNHLTVLMTEAVDSDPWWIEGGMIMK